MRLLLCLLTLPGVYAQNGAADGATRADWPHYGGTQLSWRYSALDQVNTTNVKTLVPVWIFQTGDYAENLQATPIVVDGVMYVITPRAQVSALDAATGTPDLAVPLSSHAVRHPQKQWRRGGRR